MKRWWIALAGFCLQLSLGTAYAWSVFRIPLSKEFGWTISEVTKTFTISWFMLGCTAVLGGLWIARSGPRVVAMTGGGLWSAGVFLASFSTNRLWWLYLAYGVIGGAGLGFGYIVPISVLVKWFPDRRGFITGLAVAGFGGGSLIAAPVAQHLIVRFGTLQSFAILGVCYGFVAIAAASFMCNPPDGWRPAGWNPSTAQLAQRTSRNFTLSQSIRMWQWWLICLLLCINTMAGLSIVSQAAPIFQEVGGATAATAAGFVGIISIGNGLGRFFWSWLSDVTSRKAAFFMMYLVEAVLFWSFHNISSLVVLLIVVFVLVMCYGGAYGITPAFAADYFGPHHVGAVFGSMMLPWAFASAIGPTIFANLRQATGNYSLGIYSIASLITMSLILPLIVKPPVFGTEETALAHDGAQLNAVQEGERLP